MNEPELFPLDEDEIQSFAEIDLQEKMMAASLGGARTAILGQFCRKHKLAGIWRVAENGKEIVKVEAQPQLQPVVANGNEA